MCIKQNPVSFVAVFLTESLLCTVNNGTVFTRSIAADSLVCHKCTLLVDKALTQCTKALSRSGYKSSGRQVPLVIPFQSSSEN